MSALQKHAFISVEDYLAGEEHAETKHEYLGGTIHAMVGGTNDHAAPRQGRGYYARKMRVGSAGVPPNASPAQEPLDSA